MRARPAELPEPDKMAPTPVTAAAALCGDDHQLLSVPVLRVAAIAASKAREAAQAAVQGQRRGIVWLRVVQDPNADTLALRRAPAAMPDSPVRSTSGGAPA